MESPEDGSPVHPIDRRKATLRRRRRLSKRQGALNGHVYQDSRTQVASLFKDRRIASKEVQSPERRAHPTRYSSESAKNLIRSDDGSTARREQDSDDPDQAGRSDKQWKLDRKDRERCRSFDNSDSKLMARSR